MSKFLTKEAVQQFEAEVKHDYQAMESVLKPFVRLRNNVTGDQTKFPVMGKGVATLRGASQTDVTPMNVDHDRVPVLLSNFVAPEYTDIFDQAEQNFDERRELSQTIAAAIHRRCDQLVIDALNASAATSIAVGTTNLTVAKLRTARTLFGTKEVPKGERVILCHSENMESLLAETEVTSSDFNQVKALVQGDLDTFLGFKFVEIGDRDEGGLLKAGNNRTVLAWHKASTALAIGIDFSVHIDWVPEKTSWLCNGILKAGAGVIDVEGVVKIVADETK